jgi:superfamily II DNA or RNA helicase
LLDRVVKHLESREWRYTLTDNRTFEPVDSNYELFAGDGSGHKISLNQGKYSFQGAALDALLMNGRGILKAGTGGGKTTIAAGVINSIQRRTVWLTHRKNLMYQTQRRLENHFGEKIGLLGDGECDIANITVAMMQTVSNVLAKPSLEEHKLPFWFLLNCQVVIGDEGHRLQGKQFYEAFKQIPARWRYLLTATPPKPDGEGLYLIAQTGDVVYTITPAELITAGVLVPPRIWIVKYNSPVFPKATKWASAYSNGIVHNSVRNAAIVDVAKQFKSESKSAMTLVMRINHGEELVTRMGAAHVRAEFIHGKVKEKTREQIFADLFGGALDHVVAQATTVGEGTDLPALRALINATGMTGGGNKAEGDTGKDTLQFLGRGLRTFPGKTYFDYVDFFDVCHKSMKQATLDRVSTLESEGYAAYIKYYTDYIPESVVADSGRSHP